MGYRKVDFLKRCRRFDVLVSANPDADEDSLAKLLLTFLGGAAFSYWDSLSEAEKSNFDVTKDKLKNVFGQTAYLLTFQSYSTLIHAAAIPVKPFPCLLQKSAAW